MKKTKMNITASKWGETRTENKILVDDHGHGR